MGYDLRIGFREKLENPDKLFFHYDLEMKLKGDASLQPGIHMRLYKREADELEAFYHDGIFEDGTFGGYPEIVAQVKLSAPDDNKPLRKEQLRIAKELRDSLGAVLLDPQKKREIKN